MTGTTIEIAYANANGTPQVPLAAARADPSAEPLGALAKRGVYRRRLAAGAQDRQKLRLGRGAPLAEREVRQGSVRVVGREPAAALRLDVTRGKDVHFQARGAGPLVRAARRYPAIGPVLSPGAVPGARCRCLSFPARRSRLAFPT